MSTKTVSKLLIILGVVLILIAMNMDTNVSYGEYSVHNLSLASQQQNLLIIGCFAFIGGILLFALAKLKQSPKEDAAERIRAKVLRGKASDRFIKTSDGIKKASNTISNTTQALLSKRDWVAGRIIVAVFVEISIYLIFVNLYRAAENMGIFHIRNGPESETVSRIYEMINFLLDEKSIYVYLVILFIAIILYAFRAIPAAVATIHLLVINVVMFLAISLPSSVMLYRFLKDDTQNVLWRKELADVITSYPAFSGTSVDDLAVMIMNELEKDFAYQCFVPALISCISCVVIWKIMHSESRKQKVFPPN